MARINMKSTSLAKVIYLIVLIIVLGTQIKTSMAQAQNTCANQLGSLNVCAPFVLSGTQSSAPSAECCGALQAVEPGCLCNTFRVASQLPSACKLPALSCGNTILSEILRMKMVSIKGCVGDEEACNVAAPNCCSGLQCHEVSAGVHQCESSSCEQHIGHSCEPGLRACCAPLRCSQNTAGSFQCTA